jgi:hypothetical protein
VESLSRPECYDFRPDRNFLHENELKPLLSLFNELSIYLIKATFGKTSQKRSFSKFWTSFEAKLSGMFEHIIKFEFVSLMESQHLGALGGYLHYINNQQRETWDCPHFGDSSLSFATSVFFTIFSKSDPYF